MDDNIEFDKRFVYYLLGSTGICVIPLTSFFTSVPGFRMTLLDKDEEKFEFVVKTIAEKVVFAGSILQILCWFNLAD